MTEEYTVPEKDEGERIDRFLAASGEYSRSFLQKLLKAEKVLVNDCAVKSSYRLEAGDSITFEVPEPEDIHIEAEDIPLDIVYEDASVILVNKPKGMVVHPAPGHYSGTLVNALMYHCRNDSGPVLSTALTGTLPASSSSARTMRPTVLSQNS